MSDTKQIEEITSKVYRMQDFALKHDLVIVEITLPGGIHSFGYAHRSTIEEAASMRELNED